MKMNTINAGTVIRTVLLVLALVNQALVALGFNTFAFDNERITQVAAILFTAGTSVWSWWKNNSFTKAAQEADRYQKDIKSGVFIRRERE